MRMLRWMCGVTKNEMRMLTWMCGVTKNEMRMLRWMCGVTKKNKIRNARGGFCGKEDKGEKAEVVRTCEEERGRAHAKNNGTRNKVDRKTETRWKDLPQMTVDTRVEADNLVC